MARIVALDLVLFLIFVACVAGIISLLLFKPRRGTKRRREVNKKNE